MMLIRIAFPYVLLLVPSFILLSRWRHPVSLRYSDVCLIVAAGKGWRVHLRFLPTLVRMSAIVLMSIGLSSPEIGEYVPVRAIRGNDIVFVIDISSSMGTIYNAPLTRLDVVKQVLDRFISQVATDHIGIVVFARQAYHLVPPTLDRNQLRAAVASIPLITDLGYDDGTAIGLGLAAGANMLRTTNGTRRAIVLLTDGENTAGAISPLTAAQALVALGLPVYTLGIGSPDTEDESEPGLDESSLQRISVLTGGRYFRAADETVLQQAYDSIYQLEVTPAEQSETVVWYSTLTIWSGAALIALLVEQGLRAMVFRSVL